MSAKVQRVGLKKRALRTTFRATVEAGFVTNGAVKTIPITDSRSTVYPSVGTTDSGADISSFYRRMAIQVEFGDALGVDVTIEVSVDGANFVAAPEGIILGAAGTPNILENAAGRTAVSFIEIPISGVRVRLSLPDMGGNNTLTADMAITVLLDDAVRLGSFPLH